MDVGGQGGLGQADTAPAPPSDEMLQQVFI